MAWRVLPRRRAQMPRQARLQQAERAHDHEVQEQIDQRGADENFRRAIGLLNDLLRDAGHFPHGDETRERGGFDEQHRFRRIRRQALAQRNRADHAAQQREAREADRIACLDLPDRHGHQTAANDFRGVAGRAQSKRQHRAQVRFAQHRPEEALANHAELAHAVVHEEHLDQQRRAAKYEDISACKAIRQPVRRHPHRDDDERQQSAENQRTEEKPKRGRHGGEQLLHRVEQKVKVEIHDAVAVSCARSCA